MFGMVFEHNIFFRLSRDSSRNLWGSKFTFWRIFETSLMRPENSGILTTGVTFCVFDPSQKFKYTSSSSSTISLMSNLFVSVIISVLILHFSSLKKLPVGKIKVFKFSLKKTFAMCEKEFCVYFIAIFFTFLFNIYI